MPIQVFHCFSSLNWNHWLILWVLSIHINLHGRSNIWLKFQVSIIRSYYNQSLQSGVKTVYVFHCFSLFNYNFKILIWGLFFKSRCQCFTWKKLCNFCNIIWKHSWKLPKKDWQLHVHVYITWACSYQNNSTQRLKLKPKTSKILTQTAGRTEGRYWYYIGSHCSAVRQKFNPTGGSAFETLVKIWFGSNINPCK